MVLKSGSSMDSCTFSTVGWKPAFFGSGPRSGKATSPETVNGPVGTLPPDLGSVIVTPNSSPFLGIGAGVILKKLRCPSS